MVARCEGRPSLVFLEEKEVLAEASIVGSALRVDVGGRWIHVPLRVDVGALDNLF